MRRHLLTVGAILLATAALVAFWMLNVSLGRRTGEVDRGRWYLIKGSSGTQYYQKGIDPGNQFLDHQRAESMVAETPGYIRTDEGFGAIWIQRGWLNDAYLSSSTWKLFATEAKAVQFLNENGVEEDDILFHHK